MPYRRNQYGPVSGVPEFEIKGGMPKEGGVNRHESSIGSGGRPGKPKEQWYITNTFTEAHIPMSLARPGVLQNYHGWRFRDLPAGKFAILRAGWVQWDSGFSDTAQPPAVLGLSDSLRTALLNGTYRPATWIIDLPFRNYNANIPHFRARLRIWKGNGVTGAGAVQLTSEAQLSNDVRPNLMIIDTIARFEVAMPQVVCTNEYLFFQIAAEIMTQGPTNSHGILVSGLLPCLTLPPIRET